MSTETQSVTNLFEQVYDNLKKVAESNLEMQQDVFKKWTTNWPGFPQTDSAWLEQVQKYQKAWVTTAKELLAKHREVAEQQYRLASDSLEEAFRVAQSSDPEEYAKRCESLCRKSLEVLREAGELQAKEMQEAFHKWMNLAGKSAV